MPVVIDRYVIGAVGVAGGTSSDDAAAALAAVEAILALALEPLERDAPGEVYA